MMSARDVAINIIAFPMRATMATVKFAANCNVQPSGTADSCSNICNF